MTFGHAFKSAEFSEAPEDVRLLRGDNIAPGRLRWDGAKRFPVEKVGELRNYQLSLGDVVIAMDRPWIGAGLKYSVLRPEDLPCLLVQRVARLRAREGLEQGYLAAIIGSKAFTDYVVGVQTGSAVPHISGGQIADFEVPDLPARPIQRAIAATLGSLDEKVASNSRLALLIPALIEARINQALNERRERAPVSALGSFVNGGAYTKGASGNGRIVIRIAELNNGPGSSTVYNDIDVPETQTASSGDILMSWSGSLGVYRWTREEAIINQHIFKVVPNEYPAWLVFDRLRSAIEVFRRIAQDKATTMGHIQRSHLATTFVDLPTSSTIKALDDELGPLWDRLLLAEQESLKLAALRDALLPALLSGSLRVREENDLVSGVDRVGEN